MESIRLIYEQIEEAKRYLLTGSLLHLRLALILLDNAVELMMYRELEYEFAWYDQWEPKWEPARTRWIAAGLGPKYTAKERKAAEREFDPKARILQSRLGQISADERNIICVCHKLRCETFHRGHLRREILLPVCKLLFLTVAGVTLKLRARAYGFESSAREDAEFFERFGLQNALSLANDDGYQQLYRILVAEIVLDEQELCQLLSEDLVERLEDTISRLAELGETPNEAQIDHNLQYTQFWRDQGAKLAKEGLREPGLTEAFQRWKSAGRARYSLSKIRLWQKRAENIARRRNPAHALVDYLAIENRFSALERDVIKALITYEEEIDAQIHEA